MSGSAVEHRVGRDRVDFWYSASIPPVLAIEPGERVLFETLDARSGALAHIPAGTLFELPKPPVGRGNPLTGPVAVRGARPGDALAVTVETIDCLPPGWAGGHAHVNPLAPGRIPRPLGRSFALENGDVVFSDRVRFPARPMIGCIGTAVAGEPVNAGNAGRHGGNMDQKILTAGTTVHLPVYVPDALLYVGDIHAGQGDGELSGVGLEISADVTVRVDLEPGLALSWPWIETPDVLAVTAAAHEFVDARREAVDAMLTVIERQLGMEPAEGLALLSAVADLRIGQAFGGAIEMTVRVEVPRSLGLRPG